MAGRTVRRAGWIPLVAVAALGVAACGDDDDDNGADTTAVADESGTTVGVGADDAGNGGDDGNDGNGGDEAQAVDITMVGVAEGFAPPTVTVAAGTEVTWTNVDVLTHTATADDGTFDSGNLGVSESFSFVADEPGTYPYICTIHPSMVGELVVE